MSIPEGIRNNIINELRSIESKESVRILFAIESGSRAWGFPSPDSDYDVRFVYLRQPKDYVRLAPIRDVIERPIDEDLDISGWDVQKALDLLLKPNPVLLEWLQSPIRYIWDETICDQLINLARKITHQPASSYHYLHLGQNTWERNIQGKRNFKLKKYFYVLRPAMALKYLSNNPDKLPPMRFQDLIAGVDLPQDLKDVIFDLIETKSKMNESELSEAIPIIDDFVNHEFEQARERLKGLRKPMEDYWADANKLFQDLVFLSQPQIQSQTQHSITHAPR